MSTLSQTDHERLSAARDKKARKLLRYTSTPAAKAQRAETEAEHNAGIAEGRIIQPPAEIYRLTEAEEIESTMTLDEAVVACGLAYWHPVTGKLVEIWLGLPKRLVVRAVTISI